jgi:ribosomal protein RSM22 (predicted rRNA methylase)
MPSDKPGFMIRPPPEVREALQVSANANGRSLNKEVIARLEASLKRTFAQARPAAITVQVAHRDERKLALVHGTGGDRTRYIIEDPVARKGHSLYNLLDLSDNEKRMLDFFRGLSAPKQLALIALLDKG